MQPYRDWDNDSGVVGYEIGSGYIIVEFRSGREHYYKYTDTSAGTYHIAQMCRLAEAGDGLNEYIIKNKVTFESKW